MNSVAALPSLAAAATRRGQAKRTNSLRVRAEASTSAETEGAYVSYTGKNGQRQTYEAAVKSGDIYKASSVTGIAAPGTTSNPSISLGDAMSFGGPAPETFNGRMAMIGFVAALGAELASQETVVKQLSEQPTGVALLVVLFAAATLIPLIEGKKAEAVGPLTPSAELINGRAAMLGFASLLITEGITGKAFF